MSEEVKPQKTLWMLAYQDGIGHKLQPFYAVSEEDAENQAQAWLRQSPHTVVRLSLRPYPTGFIVQGGQGLEGSK